MERCVQMNFDYFIHKNNSRRNAYLLSGVLFTCGLIIGGAAAALALDCKKQVDGKDVLESVKALFTKDGPVEGSWIELQPVNADRFGQEQAVYYGGVSRKEDGKLIQYEFIADAENGRIIDLYAI